MRDRARRTGSGWAAAAATVGLLSAMAASGIEIGGRNIPREKFIVIVTTGDSCAQGADGGSAWNEDFTAPNLWAFDWRRGEPKPQWLPADKNASALVDGRVRAGISLGFCVAKPLARAFPNHHFGFVNVAYSQGHQLAHFDLWAPHLAPYLEQLTVGAVIMDFGYRGFQQTDGATYIARMREVLKAPDVPVLLTAGRLNATDPRYELRGGPDNIPGTRPGEVFSLVRQFDALAQKLARCATVPAEGLNMSDNRHQRYWTGNAIFGQRCADTLVAMGWAVPGGVPDREGPTAPANLRVVRRWNTGVTLAWDAARDNLAVEGYELFAEGTKIQYWPGLPATLRHVTTVATQFPVTGLKPGSVHQFAVRARDCAGNVSAASAPLPVALGTALPVKLPLKINLGGTAVGDWAPDKEFRDGEDYGYALSPAQRGDWEGKDYQRNPNDSKAPTSPYDAARATYADADPRRVVFRTFRTGNTTYKLVLPDGRYRATWWLEGAPGEDGETAYPDGQLAGLCRVRKQEETVSGGRLFLPIPGDGRAKAYALIVEAAP